MLRVARLSLVYFSMAKLFRSEEMTYMQAIVPAEAARAVAFRLALLNCAQLTDVRFFVCLFDWTFGSCPMIFTTSAQLTGG